MNSGTTIKGFGWRVFGLGIIALGVISLAWGNFDPGQPVPKNFPYRATLAYVAAIFMICAGTAIEWRRITAWGAAVITLYYTFIVVFLMDGRVILRNSTEFIAYSNTAEQLAIAAGALIVYAASANIDSIRAARLTRIGQIAFGICAVLFGGAHFFYMNLTAPLVPKWLPPSQVFWGYATGVAHVAAGVAIIARVQARLASVLLTIMYVSFMPLVLVPLLFADAANFGAWSENATNLALIGAAWVVADSFANRR